MSSSDESNQLLSRWEEMKAQGITLPLGPEHRVRQTMAGRQVVEVAEPSLEAAEDLVDHLAPDR